MRVQVSSASEVFNKAIIEAESIDDAINRLRTDKELIASLIDKNYSWLYNKDDGTISTPNSFSVDIIPGENYDIAIDIYDYWLD